MPVDGVLPTVPVEAGSKHQFVTLCDALYQFYEAGISQADFRAKMSIAYKEALETKYWLSLLKDTNYIEEKAFESIHQDADEISKILFSIIKKTEKADN